MDEAVETTTEEPAIESAEEAVENQIGDVDGTVKVDSLESGETKQAAPSSLKEVKALPSNMDDYVVELTIDGEPRQMTVREMKKLTSLEQASHKRFQEAQGLAKKVQSVFERWRANPDEYFKAAGIDSVQYSEAKLREAVRVAEMSPEQRAYEEKEAQLSSKEREIADFYERKAQSDIDQGIGEAFKEVGLPKSPFLVARIAALVSQSIDYAQKNDGAQPLSYKEAASRVKIWFQNGIKETLTNLPENQIVEYLGPENVAKLKKYFVSQVSGPATTKGPATAASTTSVKPKSKTKPVFRSWKEYHDHIDSL